jgi:hypothetical protein
MPRSSDDDAPRWELPEWEPLPGSPSGSAPRWEARRETPRWQPGRGPAARGRAHVDAGAASVPRVPASGASPLARPFVWWAAHPWIVVWVLVPLTPAAVVLLRALDESGLEVLVQPLSWLLVALFTVALALAMLTSARRSASRLAAGTVATLAALGALLWPVTQVTLGRTACPARAGADLGGPVASRALEAWQAGAGGDRGWRSGRADGAWLARSRALRLVDYQLVDTGCWERAAPIDATRTWHEFRVTVEDGGPVSLSKSLLVHTAVGADGWKIAAIEGPLP